MLVANMNHPPACHNVGFQRPIHMYMKGTDMADPSKARPDSAMSSAQSVGEEVGKLKSVVVVCSNT